MSGKTSLSVKKTKLPNKEAPTFNNQCFLKPIGLSTIQLIRTRRGIEFLEINPRFGGGAPMSIHSGADFCEYLYRLLRGESLSYREDYLDNITFLRFDSSICINDDLEVLPLQSDQ